MVFAHSSPSHVSLARVVRSKSWLSFTSSAIGLSTPHLAQLERAEFPQLCPHRAAASIFACLLVGTVRLDGALGLAEACASSAIGRPLRDGSVKCRSDCRSAATLGRSWTKRRLFPRSPATPGPPREGELTDPTLIQPRAAWCRSI